MSTNNYKNLGVHINHNIQVVTYVNGNVAIKCMDCNKLLTDFERIGLTDLDVLDYINNDGDKCPRCGCVVPDKLSISSSHENEGKAWFDCYCEECDFSWIAVYALIGVETSNQTIHLVCDVNRKEVAYKEAQHATDR